MHVCTDLSALTAEEASRYSLQNFHVSAAKHLEIEKLHFPVRGWMFVRISYYVQGPKSLSSFS